MHGSRLLFVMLPSALALSGCIAAAIPVVAGGAVARSAAKKKAAAPPAPVKPADASRTTVVAAPLPPPLPSDSAQIRPGQVYTGAMPRPGVALVTPAPATMPAPAASDWSDVGHHVAAELSPEHSVLLARGSDAADPRWVSCKDKPLAIVATVSSVLAGDAVDPSARQWLDALRVLEVRPVLIASTATEATAVREAFAKAGLGAPTDADTLMLATSDGRMPAIRADVGTRYCVLAVVGRTAADFPNGLTPTTTPPALAPLWGHGWFLLAGRPGGRP